MNADRFETRVVEERLWTIILEAAILCFVVAGSCSRTMQGDDPLSEVDGSERGEVL